MDSTKKNEAAHDAPAYPAPRDRLLGVAVGYMASQAVYTAARLGTADLLARTGPADAASVAEACDCDPAATARLLLALVACGVLVRDEAGRYDLTEVGRALCEDAPGSARRLVLLYGSAPVWNAWALLPESIASGTTAFAALHGMGAFEYCATHPDTARLFHAAMAQETALAAEQLLARHDFAGAGRIADLGGGDGTLLAGLLRALPQAHGILLDTAHGVAAAPRVLAEAGVSQRCEILVADFFETAPSADVYVLKSVVHDWDDADAVRLLATCRAAMHPGARLLLVERILPTRPAPGPDPLMVRNLLNMPTIIGGRERTAEEFGKLLAQAGLALGPVEALPGLGDHFLLEAAPA